MRTAYKCRAYPAPEQAAVLNRTFGCVRKVWNQVLDWRTHHYRTQGTRMSYAQSDRYLTHLKRTEQLAFSTRSRRYRCSRRYGTSPPPSRTSSPSALAIPVSSPAKADKPPPIPVRRSGCAAVNCSWPR
ncbi:hypothetical protein E1293_06855 [Actinomadura darangshiensis]|uniref:Transposase putative helix-turn-helix domain-containing protein n=1 Tax=Actinomadura darangshiensis TaxID=705336 RepID=A0A4R5BMV5_9ACTN|nr:helix-turn-helix domain-containing protein [Actinomadura darangshiensis]TDD88151.1 hypothetical protein E1293_06855 [Actinomadura darangshiensis]